jgi:outer membrane receptor protein involved in Fe transport
MKLVQTVLTGILVILSVSLSQVNAQEIRGRVFQHDASGKEKSPLPGAAVYRIDQSAATQSDLNGFFVLPAGGSDTIVFSFVGFLSDTLLVKKSNKLEVILKPGTELKEFEIEARKQSNYVSSLNPIKTEVLTRAELQKAACCNLSESFETNNTVSTITTDAVTGTRQIEMLGLSGVYTQIQSENLPQMRGFLSHSGLAQIPGTWIENIHIGKGVGSVVNGFESITGQIDIQLRQPFGKEKLHFNLYTNQRGRNELNYFQDIPIGKNWSTLTMLHGSIMQLQIDRNQDGFMDNPDSKQWNVENRWKYFGKRSELQFGFHALQDERVSGTTHEHNEMAEEHAWRYESDITRADAFYKLGIIYPGKPYKSLAFLGNGFFYRQSTELGYRFYDASWNSGSTQMIYQNYFGSDECYSFRTGFNVLYDDMDEVFSGMSFSRREANAGAFFESTLKFGSFTMIDGLRLDYNNLFGWFITPRMHLKLDITEQTVLRLAGGRGRRTANIIEENLGYFASARKLKILPSTSDASSGYGLLPELGWNFGGGINHQYKWGRRAGSLGADAWYTLFERQTVADLEHSPQEILFYNLRYGSSALSCQFDWSQEIGRPLQARFSYKYTQARTEFTAGSLFRPFVPAHRALMNLEWKARKDKWLVDLTITYQGEKRLPTSSSNPPEFQMRRRSPDFTLINGQVTRNIKKIALYIGVENLLDFRQMRQIVSAGNPHSQWFDSSYIWGPTLGRIIYVGMRWQLDRVEE